MTCFLISSLTNGMFRTSCRVWFEVYRGTFINIRGVFDWNFCNIFVFNFYYCTLILIKKGQDTAVTNVNLLYFMQMIIEVEWTWSFRDAFSAEGLTFSSLCRKLFYIETDWPGEQFMLLIGIIWPDNKWKQKQLHVVNNFISKHKYAKLVNTVSGFFFSFVSGWSEQLYWR